MAEAVTQAVSSMQDAAEAQLRPVTDQIGAVTVIGREGLNGF